VLAYVFLVFLAFMAMAWFGFHSLAAVKALALAAVGYGVALTPALLTRIEYELDDHGVRQRTLDRKKARAFQELFRWEELSHIVALRRGFKFFRPLSEPNALRRFWKKHLSDAYSGEVHVEAAERECVLEAVGAHLPALQECPWNP